MDHSTLNWISRLCPNLEELVLDNGLIKRKAAKQFARNVKGEKVRLEPTTVQKQVQPDEQDMSSPDCSLVHPRLLGESRLKPCLGPGYFLLKVSDCMLETCMLLSGVRVHEHRWEWVFIICIICCVNLFISNSLHFTHAKFNATFQCALRSLSKQAYNQLGVLIVIFQWLFSYTLKISGLRRLVLNFSVSISEASVKRILKNSPNLECLELTGNVLYLTGNCFQKCSDGLKVLKVANQNGLLPEHLQVKLQHLSNWDGRYVAILSTFYDHSLRLFWDRVHDSRVVRYAMDSMIMLSVFLC